MTAMLPLRLKPFASSPEGAQMPGVLRKKQVFSLLRRNSPMSKKLPSCVLAMLFAVAPTLAQNYEQNITVTNTWLQTQILSDGAILDTSSHINPYFANLAALGMLKGDQIRISQVKAWITWYINHFNWPDYNGIYGTVYNYTVDGTAETSNRDYDSADSYAATFLSLTWALWETGESGAQAFIKGIGEYDFNVVGNIITNLQLNTGLVYAKPNHQIEFTIDNTEDYRGLMDLADLMVAAWGDTNGSHWYIAHATELQNGIQSVLYDSGLKLYYTSAGAALPNLAKWYPDSVAQLFPIANGVIAASSVQAKTLYSRFNGAWPDWNKLSFNIQDLFPWAVVSYAAVLMGDTPRANTYITTIENKYQDVGFPWPWYCAEAGWYLRTNAYFRN
jgi:hypothetical protein